LDTSAAKGSAAHAPARKAPAAGRSTKPSTAKGPVAEPGELQTARLGGRIQFADSSGGHATDITVARKLVRSWLPDPSWPPAPSSGAPQGASGRSSVS
jgi:hypothetical protein